MKRLSLVRHANSDRGDPALADFRRPLNARGREEAALLGSFMLDSEIKPDCVLCSPSVRTRQTLELICERLPDSPCFIFFPETLYNSSPEEVIRELKAESNSCSHVLLIGHNPAMHQAARDLADQARSDGGALKRLNDGFPTAALAVFDFDVTAWSQAGRGKGALAMFKTPQELRGGDGEVRGTE